ncbi:MAG: glucoamylase family protein [Bacteroidales bacterium]|nr:glucoamylase family protein [Bacteroidales bacterium]
MKNHYNNYFFFLIIIGFCSCGKDPLPDSKVLQLVLGKAGDAPLSTSQSTTNIPLDAVFYINFTSAVDTASVRKGITIKNETNNTLVPYNVSYSDSIKTIILQPVNQLQQLTNHSIDINSKLLGANKETFPGVRFLFETAAGRLTIKSLLLNGQSFLNSALRNVDYQNIEIKITFSEKLNPASYLSFIFLYPSVGLTTSLSTDQKTLTLVNTTNLKYYTRYSFTIISDLMAENGFPFEGFSGSFYTGLDPSLKFPLLSDEALMTLVQQRTFRYFWDFAHLVSGLARERKNSDETVTIGGSGFGVMAIPIGIERGFITRTQGVERLNKIVNFLSTANRFHGVWPHWMNGTSGVTIPFSTKDNGGDLVETSYMAAGLLCVRQYLRPENNFELSLINKINTLLNGIEWSWYTRGGQNVLYWHWSPNYGWDMNMQVKGYNEALITYFMAATSTTFPIAAPVYHQGWAGSSYFINGKTFYGIPLPLGFDYGGPLFFAHYSFLGLNPTNLSDQYANYWVQNVNHTRINRQYCIVNPKNHVGYSADCWGLTASDDPSGYSVHEPTRDNGTISPTAALSSMPFTPNESMQAMRFFYYILGDKLFGEYGFYDAFNPHQGWWANSYLAIDQGPVIVMIENYRTGLCWNLFMSAPEVQQAMIKFGFSN